MANMYLVLTRFVLHVGRDIHNFVVKFHGVVVCLRLELRALPSEVVVALGPPKFFAAMPASPKPPQLEYQTLKSSLPPTVHSPRHPSIL
jgi:hypothetical protein